MGADSMAARLVPTLRYRDVAAAVDWLCSAFGFKRIRVVTGVDASILQAHLGFGNDIIMLLPARDFAAAPDLAVADLQSCYFVVDDADQHHRNAKAAGAEIQDVRHYDLGGRGYSCRDPEGHVWSFGTYDPRQRQSDPLQRKPQYDPRVGRPSTSHQPGHAIADAAVGLRPRITLASVTTALATVVVSAATIGWLLGALPKPAASARDTQDTKVVSRLVDDGSPEKVVDNPTPLPAEKAQTPERTRAPLLFGSPAVQQRAAEEEKPAAPRAPQLVEEPAPERAANQASQQVAERDPEQAAKEAAERAALDALKQWREAQEKLRQLARERSAKEAAEQAELEARQRAAKAAREPPRAPVNTGPRKRAIAAKEAPKPAVKEAPAKPRAPERTGVQAAKADAPKDARQAPAKKADAGTCPTNPTSGKAVCHPREKKPVARAPESVVRTSRMGSAEPTKAEPPKKAEPAPNSASDQIWDCVPRPPEGKVICHPIPNRP